jgi:hypothetical protein
MRWVDADIGDDRETPPYAKEGFETMMEVISPRRRPQSSRIYLLVE